MITRYLTAFVLLLAVAVQADERKDAIALVRGAVAYGAKNGNEKLVAELKKSDGRFVQGDLYVFAYDLSGTMVAHPKNAKLIGKNLLDVPDVDGKLFRKDIIELAKSSGSGWVDYKYKNPETGKVEDKTTYVLRSGDLVICCGIYRQE